MTLMDVTDSWKIRVNSWSVSLWTNCIGPPGNREGVANSARARNLRYPLMITRAWKSHGRSYFRGILSSKTHKWVSCSCTDLSRLIMRFILWDPQAKFARHCYLSREGTEGVFFYGLILPPQQKYHIFRETVVDLLKGHKVGEHT